MTSNYESIKTAKELCEYVSAHGLPTRQEDILRAQDIFGRSTVDELVALAGDNGRQNADGRPDPRGSWYSGKDGLSEVFYSILFHIWNWRDAVDFYNRHSNFPVIDAIENNKTLSKENEQSQKDIEYLKKEIDTMKAEALSENDLIQLYHLVENDLELLEESLSMAEQDIIANAETPDGEDFKTAVSIHRETSDQIFQMHELLEHLKKLKGEQ